MAQLDLLTSVMPPAMPVTHLAVPGASLPAKASDAYKTISEVALEIDVPQHVLRFWESHFPQVKPSRMRGSRRYYRPEDVELLKTIKTLLYKKGYTIKGAKKVVRGKHALADTAPPALPAAAAPAMPKSLPEKKNIDVQSLVSELRVLKSMLTSLL
jgi:DNA-binding transcriptional MerR regulator